MERTHAWLLQVVPHRVGAAQFPVMKRLAECGFDAAPVNEALVRSRHDGDVMDQTATPCSSAEPRPALYR